MKEKPKYISLFSGAGGFDLGFHNSGWHCLAMVEYAKDACETLRANFTIEGWERCCNAHINRVNQQYLEGTCSEIERLKWFDDIENQRKNHNITKSEGYKEPIIFERDICTVSSEELMKACNIKPGEIHAIVGGPPCQGFSAANTQKIIDDPRNKLYKEYVRLLTDIQPKTFVLENVRGLASMEKGAVIRQMCEDFVFAGYQVSWELINMADYGVPQNRIRIIMIGKWAEDQDMHQSLARTITPSIWVHHDKKYQDKWNKEILKTYG